jgi:DNA repair exonuclease SbcCD ATPase subunit
MKWYLPVLCISVFSATIGAQQTETDPCAGLVGAALGECQGNQQTLLRQQLTQQQQQLTQQQRELSQQQQQLAQQQKQLEQQQQQLVRQQQQLHQQAGQSPLNERPQNQQQLEDMQHQIELLGKQVEHQKSANQPATPAAAESRRREIQNWKADNRWYGSDYIKTQFAMRYARQLQQEQPDLVGRPFLDAISAKVTDKFGTSK